MLSADQCVSGLEWIKDLVAKCEPSSRADAVQMLSVACRFASDSTPEYKSIDWDALFVEAQVGRWANIQLAAGMPASSIEQRLVLLRRMLRVRHGLPSRIPMTGSTSRVYAPLNDAARVVLEASLLSASDQVRGAYVAGFGANRIGVAAAGGRIAVDASGSTRLLLEDCSLRVVIGVEAAASGLDGVVLTREAWQLFREQCRALGINVTVDVARATNAVLALSENDTTVNLVSQFALTSRRIDKAAGFLPAVDQISRRDLLRG